MISAPAFRDPRDIVPFYPILFNYAFGWPPTASLRSRDWVLERLSDDDLPEPGNPREDSLKTFEQRGGRAANVLRRREALSGAPLARRKEYHRSFPVQTRPSVH